MRDNIANEANTLAEQCGLPLKCTATLRDKVQLYGSARWGIKVRRRIEDLAHYFLTLRKMTVDQRKALHEVAQKISIKGIGNWCLEEINNVWRRLKTEEKGTADEAGCRLRLGAILINTGIVLQYTHIRNSSRECGWLPLKFERAPSGGSRLSAVRSINTNTFGKDIYGTF